MNKKSEPVANPEANGFNARRNRVGNWLANVGAVAAIVGAATAFTMIYQASREGDKARAYDKMSSHIEKTIGDPHKKSVATEHPVAANNYFRAERLADEHEAQADGKKPVALIGGGAFLSGLVLIGAGVMCMSYPKEASPEIPEAPSEPIS